MVFKCQEDSFLKNFSARVVSCVEIAGENKFEVILQDTILFPEGGGQPCDYGTINDSVQVRKVIRREDKAVHITDRRLDIGADAVQVIDWGRRFDHMQQHSGQHLVTAVLDREFKFYTVSWYLGDDHAYIELDTPSISQEQIDKAEGLCNELIRAQTPVTVQVFDENTPASELDSFRSAKGLPEDHKGGIRVVTIEGIESNMCCGTHVTNLSQLQVVKLLHWEKSKRKGQILLYFLIGNRVISRLDEALKREMKLSAVLKTNPWQHPEFVEKLVQASKSTNKNLQTVLKELALYEVEKIKSCEEKYFILHKKEADSMFMNVILKESGRKDLFLFLSVGDEKGAGNIVLSGDLKALNELSPRISELLDGKGALQGDRFQAKVNKMAKRKEAIQVIKDYFK